jgi:hypothetical protein
VRLLLDENVHVRVAGALATLGVDAVHAIDAGLQGSSDVTLFEWAAREDRVIVTRDYADFAHLARVAARSGRRFAGVLFLSRLLRPDDVGGIARALQERLRTGPRLDGGMDWVTMRSTGE